MAQTAAQRAVDVFVSAVQARGGKAEVQTKGSVTLVIVTVNGRTETLRVKGTTTDTWQARKSEATAKAPVTAWALVDLSDGAPIALVGADEYAAHVAKLAKAWEGKNPGKSLTANTTLAVTADDVASWEDAWGVIGLADAAPAATTIAEKPAEKAATNSTPAKKAPAKKAPAKKAPAKKAAAKKAPAKTAPAKASADAAKKAPAKTAPAKKAPAKAAAPVKASDAKITPIAEQKDAASKAKAPASISTPKEESPAKPAAKSSTSDVKAADSAPKGGKKKSKKDDGASGIGAVLKRIPVVGRLL